MNYQQCKNCDHLFPLTENCLLRKTTIDKVVECDNNRGLVSYDVKVNTISRVKRFKSLKTKDMED